MEVAHLGAILGASWNHLGDHLGHPGPSWGHLGTILGHLRPSWDHLGDHFWASGAILRPSGDHLGPFRAMLGPSWDHLGTVLGHLGPSWGHFGTVLACYRHDKQKEDLLWLLEGSVSYKTMVPDKVFVAICSILDRLAPHFGPILGPKTGPKIGKNLFKNWLRFLIPFFGGFGALWVPLGGLPGHSEAVLDGLGPQKP